MAPRVIALAEWEQRLLDGVVLSPSERRLADQLRATSETRLGIEELRTGIRITATSWVGVVRFEQFDVRVVPKLAAGNTGLVDLIEFATDLDALRRLPAARDLATEGLGLLDLLALLLAEAAGRLLTAGLYRDYVEQEDDLPVIRGRILLERQLRHHFGRLDRVACRFDEQDCDTWENRLVAAGLRVCAARATHPAIRRRLRILKEVFEQVCDPEQLDLTSGLDGSYHRLNEHYRDAHGLARLILQGLGTRDLLAPGATSCFAFLLDMNRLFEDFVVRFVQHAVEATAGEVRYQARDRSIIWDVGTGRPYAAVIPDVLIRRRDGLIIPVDAKYKLYDERRIAPSDIYQCFLYASAYASLSTPRALLIYPGAGPGVSQIRLQLRVPPRPMLGEVLALGVPIAPAIAEARRRHSGPITQHVREAIGLLTASGTHAILAPESDLVLLPAGQGAQ